MKKNTSIKRIERGFFASLFLKRFTSISIISMMLLMGLYITFDEDQIGVEGKLITVDDSGGADYLTIQAAINAATNGDTILVMNGSYTESVNLNKVVFLKGESLSGTIITNTADHTIKISSSNVNIENFTIKYQGTSTSTAGVYNVGYLNVNITNCIITSKAYGIYCSNSDSNIINTLIHNCTEGIFIKAVANGNSNGNIYVENSKLIDNNDGIKVRIRIVNSYSGTYSAYYYLTINGTQFKDNKENGLNISVYGYKSVWHQGVVVRSYTTVTNSTFNNNANGIFTDYYSHQSNVYYELFLTNVSIENSTKLGIELDQIYLAEKDTHVVNSGDSDWHGFCDTISDWTWRAESTYNFTGVVNINSGHQLTVEPGTTVNFNKDNGKVVIAGVLETIGSEQEPIRFTNDDNGSSGYWEGIQFTNSIQYSRMKNIQLYFAKNGLNPTSGLLLIENSSVRDCSEAGILLIDTGIKMMNTTISNCNDGLVIKSSHSYNSEGDVDIFNSKFINNENDGIFIEIKKVNTNTGTYSGIYYLDIDGSEFLNNNGCGLNISVYGYKVYWHQNAYVRLYTSIINSTFKNNTNGILTDYYNYQSNVYYDLTMTNITIENSTNLGIELDQIYLAEKDTHIVNSGDWDWHGYCNTIGDWTWRNESTYNFTNEVVIETGNKLVIEPGTTATFLEDSGKLTVKGTIEANGTVNDKILLTVSNRSGNSYWKSVDILNYQKNSIEFVEISYAETGINLHDSSLLINNCSIHNCSSNGVYIENSDVKMYNTNIVYCGDGIKIIAFSESLHYTAPSNGLSEGIIDIENCSIENCTESGLEAVIWIYNSVQSSGSYKADYELHISNSTIRGNGNIGLNLSTYGYSWHNWAQYSYVYFDTYLDNTTICNNKNGISTYYLQRRKSTVRSNLEVKYSSIRENNVGVDLPSWYNVDFNNNTIYENLIGIKVGSCTYSPEIHHNIIWNNDEFGVEAGNYSSEVNAQYNWWGTLDGPYNAKNNPNGTGNNVTDNVLIEPYGYGSDLTPKVGYTGEQFLFSAFIFEYIGVKGLSVEYWFGNETHENKIMAGLILFTYEITVPLNSTDTLHYRFKGTDSIGNYFITEVKDVTIIDNVKPTFGADHTVNITNTGDTLSFEIEVADNIDVQSVLVEYWFGSGPHYNWSMNGSFVYTVNLTIPINDVGPLHYIFHACDTWDNWNKTEEKVVTITDNIKPHFMNDLTPSTGTTGDLFTFSIIVDDNFDVQTVTVEYWFGNDTHLNATMSGLGTFSYTIKVPLNSLDNLTYKFHASDYEGNWNQTNASIVIIMDNDRPIFGSDLSSTVATTGDTFWFNIMVSDNIELEMVKVEYWFGVGTHNNVSMVPGAVYSYSIQIPSNNTASLHYIFHANDTSGNWNLTEQKDIIVQDNDRPHFGIDQTMAVGTTGDPFTFSIMVYDNIDVQTVTVEYWYGSGKPYNTTLSGTGSYTLEISIQSNSLDKLYYMFHAGDSYGNWNNTVEKEVTILDNDKPTFVSDNTPSIGYTGDMFTFDIEIHDNIQTGNATVEYWFRTGPHSNSSLEKSTNYQLTIQIPLNSLDTLHYIFHANDTSNNWNASNIDEVLIHDNDQPTFGSNNTPEKGYTGDPFNFSIEVTDNIDVQTVTIEYWFGTGTHTNTSLVKSTNYQLTIQIPLNSLDTLHYIFHAGDTSNNWNASNSDFVLIYDNDKPMFGNDTKHTNGTTGDPFTFMIKISDNIQVNNATVEYWFGTGPHANSSMVKFTNYELTIQIPSNSLDTLYYIFHAFDTSNNSNQTDTFSAQIIDNDGPTFGPDLSSSVATTGDTFWFKIKVSDNIKFDLVTLEYWFGTGNHSNVSMITGTTYSYSIQIPSNSTLPLHYNFSAKDTTGNWNQVQQKDVIVLDNDRPYFSVDWTLSKGTTGDPFTFSITVYDNINVKEVTVEYWYGSGSHANRSLLGLVNFNLVIDLQSNSLDDLHYIFHAGDSSNNWNSTVEKEVTILDNDKPIILNDLSADKAYTGDQFTFEVEIIDNIDVNTAAVEYWFGNGPHTNTSLIKDYDHKLKIQIPKNSLDSLHYFFYANDTSNNWNTSNVVDVLIYDNDKVEFVLDQTPTICTTGEPLEFKVRVVDNIDVGLVTVEYWFGTNDHYNVSMVSETLYSYSILIPSDNIMPLYYLFHANDTSGNWNWTQQKEITIQDNDRPIFGIDRTRSVGTTGDLFTFSIEVFDNIDIQEVIVEYWYDSGAHTNSSLSGSVTFVLVINIQSNSLDSLHYIFHAGDSNNNWNSTVEKEVTILDNDKPTFVNDLSASIGYTGDQFTFEVEITDNMDVNSATVEYWFGNGEHINLTLVKSPNYQLDIQIPSNSLDVLHYTFQANDTSDNWNASNVADILIYDNDRPEFNLDQTPKNGTPGEPLEFKVQFIDNIDVGSVTLEYWYSGKSPSKSSMMRMPNNFWMVTIILPTDSNDILYYSFRANDNSSNWNETTTMDVVLEVVDEPGPQPKPDEDNKKFINKETDTNWWIIIILIIIVAIVVVSILFLRQRRRPEKEIFESNEEMEYYDQSNNFEEDTYSTDEKPSTNKIIKKKKMKVKRV